MVLLVSITVQDIHGEKFTVLAENDAQVLGLKLQIWEQRAIAPENQRLVFAGRQLQDDETLCTIGVQSGSVVFMVQHGEQTQAVNVPAVNPPPVVSSIQQPPQQYVQAMNIAPPVVAPQVVQDTCCCCIPLRAGALVLLVLSAIGHAIAGSGMIWFTLLGLLFDALGFYGWTKHKSKFLMSWVWFKMVTLFLATVAAIVGTVWVIVKGLPPMHHHGHHGHGHHGGNHHGNTNTGNSMSSSSTTAPPHFEMNTHMKVMVGLGVGLILIVVVGISGYFIKAVHRYVKVLRNEESGQAPVQNVNGVVYQQV